MAAVFQTDDEPDQESGLQFGDVEVEDERAGPMINATQASMPILSPQALASAVRTSSAVCTSTQKDTGTTAALDHDEEGEDEEGEEDASSTAGSVGPHDDRQPSMQSHSYPSGLSSAFGDSGITELGGGGSDAEDEEGEGGVLDSVDAHSLLTTTSQALGTLSQLSLTSNSAPVHAAPTVENAQQQVGDEGSSGSSNDEQVWRQQPKHFLILTTSGKPVYTLHGDADSLAGLMALTSALVSVVQAQGDKPGHLVVPGGRGGPLMLVFLLRGPFILLAASRSGEPVEVLSRQLELLYRQVLLVVTTGVERILSRNPAYDVRPLLEGLVPVLQTLTHTLHMDASYLLRSLQPAAVPPPDQALITAALAEAVRSSGSLYGVLCVAGARAVAWERGASAAAPKGLPALDAWDLLLLDNFVACNASIRLHGEALCPLCLPSYNPAAFLHAYIHYLSPDEADGPPIVHAQAASTQPPAHADAIIPPSAGDAGQPAGSPTVPGGVQGAGDACAPPASAGDVYCVLLAPSSDAFHAMSAAREALEASLLRSGALQRLRASLSPAGAAWTSIDRLPAAAGGGKLGCTPLWHFMARFGARRQMVTCEPAPPVDTPAARYRLAVQYGRLYCLVANFPDRSRPNKLVWLSGPHLVMMALLDPEVELYCALDPLTDKPTGMKVVEQLRRHLTSRAVQAELLRPG